MIGDSVERAEVGSRLVDEAGATMNEIVDSFKHVTQIIGEITAASNEQIFSIEQVNGAIVSMDSVTQQNVILVEEAAVAAQSMQDQAGSLSQVVSMFKLTQDKKQFSLPLKTTSEMTSNGSASKKILRITPKDTRNENIRKS